MVFPITDVSAGRHLSAGVVAAVVAGVKKRLLEAGARVAFLDVTHGAHLAVAQVACAVARVPFCPLPGAGESAAVRNAVTAQFATMQPSITLDSVALDGDIGSAVTAAATYGDDENNGADMVRSTIRSEFDAAMVVTGEAASPPLYFIGTSGSTTGMPRLVEVATPQLVHYVGHLAAAVGVTAADRILLLTSPTFDPSIGDIFLAARTGATLVTADYAHIARDATDVVAKAAATYIVASPSLWRHVSPTVLPVDPTNDRAPVLLLGGERTPAALRRDWAARVRFGNLYGVTEAVGYQALSWASRDPDAPPPPDVGAILGETRLCLEPFDAADAAQNEATTAEFVPLRELVIYGPQVATRYHGGAPFNGRHPTGDIASAIDDTAGGGGFRLGGRRDFQLKLDGRRVCIEEIERLVCGAPTTSEWLSMAVCTVLNGRFVLTGVLRGVGGDGTDAPADPDDAAAAAAAPREARSAELGRRVLESLAGVVLSAAQRPAAVFVWPETEPVPVTSNGKTDRRRVQHWVEQQVVSASDGTSTDAQAQDGEYAAWVAANAPTLADVVASEEDVTAERLLRCAVDIVADCYQRVFTVPVTPNTNFFLAGGDSMLALKVAQLFAASIDAIREGGGVAADGNPTHIDPSFGDVVSGPVGPGVVARHPVVRDLALYLVRAGAISAVDVRCIDAGGASSTAAASRREKPCGQAKTATASGAEVGARWQAKAAAPVGALEQLLLDAVGAGDVDLARTLVVACGADVNCGSTRATKRTSGLHLAAARSDAAMLTLLLSHGAKVTAFDLHHVTPAHLAAQRSAACLEILVAAGAPKAIRDDRDQGLLHHATRAGNLEATRFLLYGHAGAATAAGNVPAGCDAAAKAVVARDRWQRTPLHWAVVNGHVAVTKLLVDTILAAPGGAPRRKAALSERLAKHKTHLKYESPRELARRVHGADSEVFALCDPLGDDL